MLKEFSFDHISRMCFDAGNAFLFAICDKGDSHELILSASKSISCETRCTMLVEQKRKLISLLAFKKQFAKANLQTNHKTHSNEGGKQR